MPDDVHGPPQDVEEEIPNQVRCVTSGIAISSACRSRRDRRLATERLSWLVSVLCCTWQLGTFRAIQGRPATDVAQRTAEAQSTGKTSYVGEILQTKSSMVTDAEDPTS